MLPKAHLSNIGSSSPSNLLRHAKPICKLDFQYSCWSGLDLFPDSKGYSDGSSFAFVTACSTLQSSGFTIWSCVPWT